MKEENAYILGTDIEELHRLGVQHQVWAEEAQNGWKLANFKAGDTLLDLGCGPGFCTKEMAYIAGTEGKVIGIDRSEAFIRHLEQVTNLHHLNVESVLSDFDQMKLPSNSLDGMFCRWALAWLAEPSGILKEVYDALKPGGRMVIQEYYDWQSHQTEPSLEFLNKAIAAAFKSFNDSEGIINIGRKLPGMLEGMGMKITNVRIMSKLATPSSSLWQWPKTFYYSYFPRLVDAGYLTSEEMKNAFTDLNTIENTAGATLCCPLMVEIIAEK